MSRYVKVDFLSDRDSESSNGYIYKDGLSRALKKYDTVIVPTRYGLTIAVVKGTYNESQAENLINNAYKYRTNGLTLATVKSVKEKIKSKTVDEEMKLAKADDIKRKLEAEIKKIDEVEKYRIYAELNPEVAAMLAELEELRG